MNRQRISVTMTAVALVHVLAQQQHQKEGRRREERIIQETVEDEDDEASEGGLEDVQVDAGQQETTIYSETIWDTALDQS